MKCECMSVYRNGGKTLNQAISKLQKKKKRNHNNMEWRHNITKKKKKQGDCSFALCVTLSFLFIYCEQKGRLKTREKKKSGRQYPQHQKKKKGRAEALPFQCRFPSSPHTLCRFGGKKDNERKEKTENIKQQKKKVKETKTETERERLDHGATRTIKTAEQTGRSSKTRRGKKKTR